jgi:hypothetical protein
MFLLSDFIHPLGVRKGDRHAPSVNSGGFLDALLFNLKTGGFLGACPSENLPAVFILARIYIWSGIAGYLLEIGLDALYARSMKLGCTISSIDL